VGARSSRPRHGVPSRGRHFLSPRSAAELVRAFDVGSADLVVEVGAGTGRLTRELARSARLVLAIEIDPALSSKLLRSARSWPNVFVHQGDALDTQIPGTSFRVVGNIPFDITTALLRRITQLDQVERLDLITQLETARKRAAARGSVLSVLWGTEWRFGVRRRIPARSFHPAPSVDAAWLVGERRSQPLIAPIERTSFERLVRRGFEKAGAPIDRSLGLRRSVIRAADLDPGDRAIDLTVGDWIALFRAGSGGREH
jgi:23S rRNA (adenine-N6)-dimethyltransferase